MKRKVASVVWKGFYKKLRLEPSSQWIEVPLSACVAKGDTVQIIGGELVNLCKNGQVKILPSYVALDTMSIGDENVPLVVKEITTDEELAGYKGLADFHYRDRGLHGRHSVLIIRTFNPVFPTVLGYVDLTSAFFMNKPRSEFLNRPFESDRGKWEKWGIKEQREYIHLLVRIARCVVYPEFRGIGLGKLLIQHAEHFASERWQMASLKPSFLEISADMLKHVPFAVQAGMTYIGDTEGNLQRVAKDMEYLLENTDRVKSGEILSGEMPGIVEKQLDRMVAAKGIMEQEGITVDELVKRLKYLSHEEVLKDYAMFHEIISLPKPTFIKGLTKQAEQFVVSRSKELNIQNGHVPHTPATTSISTPIAFRNLDVAYVSRVRRTRQTHAVQQAFGISPDAIKTEIIRNFSMSINPGEIVLVIGSSGSGKTSLLQIIEDIDAARKKMDISGEVALPSDFNPGILREIRSQKALIEILGGGIKESLNVMGLVGLSDAFVYLKSFNQLSKGQQFRAMLARLILSNKNVWLIDELFANIDPVTANIVAEKLNAVAKKMGVTIIATAPQWTSFIRSLKPDKVVLLTSVWEHTIVPGNELIKGLRVSNFNNISPHFIKLDSTGFSRLKRPGTHTLIRAGHLKIGSGELAILTSKNENLAMFVTRMEHFEFTELDKKLAQRLGYKTQKSLQNAVGEVANKPPITRKYTWLELRQFVKALEN